MTQTTTLVKFEITHNISHSKGWGRYKVAANGQPLVKSSTGNEWVSAGHSGEIAEGTPITATLQTMQRVGKMRKESINSTDYALIAETGASASLGYFNGLQVVVSGARLAETQAAQ